MHLHKLTLDNFKSHAHTVAEFAPGTNAICGKNYAGKTTLVQAIGLALFDCSPGTRNGDFVRQGASAATIAMEIVSALDERVYVITRKIRSSGATAEWHVRDPKVGQTLASGSDDVQDWLRDHLGVGRETDLSALFDDAVGVPQGELTSAFLQVKSNRKPRFDRLLGLEEYQAAYEKLRESRTHIDGLIGATEVKIASLGGKTRDLPGKQAALKDISGEIGALETEQDRLDKECRGLEAEKRAGEDAAARLERLKTHVARLEGWQALRAERLKIAQSRLADAEGAVTRITQSRAGYERYATAAAESVRLQSLVRQRAPLLTEKAKWQTKHAVAESEVKALKIRLAEVEHAEQALARLLPAVGRQEEGEAAVERAKGAASDAKANLKAAQEGQRESGDGLCPFFREKCRNAEATGRTLPQFFDVRIAALKEEASSADAILAAAKEALAALGNPRRQYDLAASEAAKRPAAEADIQCKARDVTECLGAAAALDARLAPYATLDADIAACQEAMAANRADDDAYRQNLALSQTVLICRAAQEHASAAARRVAEALCRRRTRRDEAAKAFDPESYRCVVKALTQARKTYDQNAGSLIEKIALRDGLQREIARLLGELEELEAEREERDRLTTLREHLGFVRNAIRSAGPQVTARLVARISYDAEQLFRALIGDQSLGLRWTEDYEILLRENGVERGLTPAAGSERVVAAIALRLGILQHMGGVRFAFFDEPTVHLDEERRASLAGRLTDLPYFTQLFVISHDDTFERTTDHVVHVEKKDGQSVIRTS